MVHFKWHYAIYNTIDVEKGMPMLNLIIKEAWIDFKPRCSIDKHSKGERATAQLVNPQRINFCSKCIFEVLPSDFSLIDDALFSNIFGSHFDIKNDNDYNNVLSAIKIKK